MYGAGLTLGAGVLFKARRLGKSRINVAKLHKQNDVYKRRIAGGRATADCGLCARADACRARASTLRSIY